MLTQSENQTPVYHRERTKSVLPTKIELAVEFLAVDYVEAVVDIGCHVADLKVEPLVMMVGVDVRVQYQVILKLPHLHATGREQPVKQLALAATVQGSWVTTRLALTQKYLQKGASGDRNPRKLGSEGAGLWLMGRGGSSVVRALGS